MYSVVNSTPDCTIIIINNNGYLYSAGIRALNVAATGESSESCRIIMPAASTAHITYQHLDCNIHFLTQQLPNFPWVKRFMITLNTPILIAGGNRRSRRKPARTSMDRENHLHIKPVPGRESNPGLSGVRRGNYRCATRSPKIYVFGS
jgi:hypothetical protein